jgi:hydrogenase maturation protease
VGRRNGYTPTLRPEEIQAAVADAVTGHIDLDLVLEVAHGLGALPERVVAVEIEPASTEPSEQLSPEVEAALPKALELVRAELHNS